RHRLGGGLLGLPAQLGGGVGADHSGTGVLRRARGVRVRADALARARRGVLRAADRADGAADLHAPAELPADARPRPAQHLRRARPAVLLHDPVRGVLPAAVLPRHLARDRGGGPPGRRGPRPHVLPDHRADELGADHHAGPVAVRAVVERVLLAAAGGQRAQRPHAHRRAGGVPRPDPAGRPGLAGADGGHPGRRAPGPAAVPRVRAQDRRLHRLLGDQMKRTTTAALAAAVLALAPACAAERPPAESGGWAETGEVTYWMWDANQLPAYQRCADEFEAANPGIDIAIEQVGWDYYWGRLLTAFVANAAPDVFVNHTSKYGDHTARGLIEPLDELIARDGPDLAQFVEGTGDLWVGDDG